MTEDSVVALHHPGVTADPLTEVLRAGARELLAQAIEAEVAAVLAAHEHLKTEDGRHRTVRTKGCLSHGTTLAMVFKLITTASKTWRRLMGNNRLPKVIEGVRFKDGMQIDETKTRAAA